MFEMSTIFLAGVWAGMIAVVVGSGTLVTFPVLLLFGHPPIVANISNNIGLAAGGLSGRWGYRKELAPAKKLIHQLLPASATGGLTGALLLFILPASAFNAVVPALIMAGIQMLAFGPSLQRRLARHRPSELVSVPPRTPVGLISGNLHPGSLWRLLWGRPGHLDRWIAGHLDHCGRAADQRSEERFSHSRQRNCRHHVHDRGVGG